MRTIQVLGKAYAVSGSVNVVCNVAGMGEVYNGPVTTTQGAVPPQNLEHEVLFSFDVPEEIQNTVVASDITVTGGTAYIVTIAVNKVIPGDLTAFETLFRETVGLKGDVRLDGVLLDAIEPDDGWHYEVPAGSTLSIDWHLNPLRAGVPGNPEVGISKLTVGQEYEITTKGDADWTLVGAADSNVGTRFTATGSLPAPAKGRCTPTYLLP